MLLNPIPPAGDDDNSRIGSEYTITSLRCRLGIYPVPEGETNVYTDQLLRVMVVKIRNDILISDGTGTPNLRTFPLNYNVSASVLTNQVDFISSSYNVEYTKNIKILYDKIFRVETGTSGVQLHKMNFKMHKKYEVQDGTNTNDLIYMLFMSDYRQSGAPEKQTVKFAIECKQSFTDS